MRIAAYIIIIIALGAVVSLVITYPVMWVGNRFLLDIGLETADYWSWFWVVVISTWIFSGSKSTEVS